MTTEDIHRYILTIQVLFWKTFIQDQLCFRMELLKTVLLKDLTVQTNMFMCIV